MRSDGPGTVTVARAGLRFDATAAGPPGGPGVLLLHGFPQDRRMWDAVTARLTAEGLATLAPDQRGYSPGARPGDAAAYRLGELVEDAVAFAGHLGGGRPVDVVGHDCGAVVAWALAAHHPSLVRTLTAVSVPHPRASLDALRHDRDQRLRSAYVALFRRPRFAEAALLAAGARPLRALLAGTGLPPQRADGYVARMREPGALRAALRWYEAQRPADLAGVGPVAVPTTYLWSDRDPALGRAGAYGCAAYVTGPFRFLVARRVGHWVPEQVPGAVADAVLARR